MSPALNNSVRFFVICLGLFVLLVLAAWCWLRPSAIPAARTAPVTNVAPAISQATINPSPVATNPLHAAGKSLVITKDAAASRQRLAELSQWLATLSPKDAAAAIRQFLDSKADAPTGQGFKIGANGALSSAPTLRVFLLDQLGRLDPAAAADYAKVILASKDSPDEWAVALRNLAWGDTSDDGRALLEQKTSEMLQYEPWQQNPSAGFLEAFDVAVYLGGASLIPTLTDLVQQQDNPAVAHASYLALDRLVINNPTATLAALLADPDLMQGREATRANYFARADVGNPQQRQILENYLLNPQIGPAEIDTFAGIFPNANYMISPNLLTQTQTPNHDALVSRDAASLNVVQQWLADPRFVPLRPSLEKTEVRLAGYVQQESRGQ
jgi:hypothetical protein